MAVASDKVTVSYDAPLVRRSVATYIWERCVREQVLMWALSGALLIYSIARWSVNDRTWLTQIAGVIALSWPMLVAFAWYAHLTSALRTLRAMQPPTADWSFNTDGFEVASSRADMRMPWTTLVEVWRKPTFWMLFTAKNQFMTLPVDQVPVVTVDHLREWLGDRIVDR